MQQNDRTTGSLWRAAYAYTDVIRSIADQHGLPRAQTELPGVLITSAIVLLAQTREVIASSPDDLADLSIGTVHKLFSDAGQVELIVHISTTLTVPAPEDPGYEAWSMLRASMDDLNDGGATGALADPGRVDRLREHRDRTWAPARRDAQGAIRLALIYAEGSNLKADATLRLWSRYIGAADA
jgi:hypothetical protein